MRFVVLDLETFFDRASGYSLDKMTTESYVRDKRFEAHGAAVKWTPDTRAYWYDEPQLRLILAKYDWSDVFLICHHFQFDGLILSHHYNVHPKLRGCTLSMARLLLGNHHSVSLDSVRKHFNMPLKSTPYNLFNGKHWNELDAYAQKAVAEGACDEVESIWRIFQELGKSFPREEYEVVDQTLAMFTEPRLCADINLLADIWESETKKKGDYLEQLGITKEELQSADQFANLLREAGEEPRFKNGKNGAIYAFAKTDDYMRELLEHDDDRVRMLAEARIGQKSTLMQTRAETWATMAQRGPLCVYLNYAGAGTLRPSGGDGSNFLNMKRQSPLRKALLAPEGYLLGPVDSSQIECRVLCYLAGQDDMIEKFRRGEDPYVGLASAAYGEPIYKPPKGDPRYDEMEAKRGMGKQGELMCGYGAAWQKFKITAKNGLYGPPVELSDEQAQLFVNTYRETHQAVCSPQTGYWAQANRMLARLAGGPPVEWGPLTVKDHRIYLPNGCPLIYDTLEYYIPPDDEKPKYREFERGGFWRVRTRSGWKTMWGSKLVQNICEAVSRVIVTQAMIRLARMGYRALNHPYDELLMLIPKDGQEQNHLAICMEEMRRPVPWLPGLPLDCEGHLGERYSK